MKSRQIVRSRVFGFTLIELLAAITIVSVLVGLSIAAFSNVGGASRIRGSVAELRSTLRYARMYALANNEAVYVLFYGNEIPAIKRLLYPNGREGFKYLKGYVCFAATQNKFVSDWKVLPDGLIFDPEIALDGLNVFDTAMRTPIEGYPGFGNTPPLMHAITYLPDGTIDVLDKMGENQEYLTIYIAEGATNAEEENKIVNGKPAPYDGSKLMHRVVKDPTYFGMRVYPLTGEVQIQEIEGT